MATYKLSPLSLFLILLVTLVVSMLFGNWWKSLSKTSEGMVSFQSGQSPLTNVHIAAYSGEAGGQYGKHVGLVWDNIYFDGDAGNLIEVDSTGFSGNGNVDSTGISIEKISVITQESKLGNINQFDYDALYNNNNKVITRVTPPAKNKIHTNYSEYVYTTQSPYTDEYCVFVLPWNDNNYIHVINKDTSTNIMTAYFGPKNTTSQITYTSSRTLPFKSGSAKTDNNLNINSFVTLSIYDSKKPVYQLSSYIYYDTHTGSVIITNEKTLIESMYSSNGLKLNTRITTDIPSSTFNAWTQYEEKNNTMILYIQNAKNVMIALISPDGLGSYKLVNVQRFNSGELDPGFSAGTPGASSFYNNNQQVNGETPTEPSNDGNVISASMTINQLVTTLNEYISTVNEGSTINQYINSPNKDVVAPTDMMNDYYQWFYYWTTKGLNNNPNSPSFNYSDDYMLKTQIVPPVCPSCPSCPSTGGACTHCGGQGGSGTQNANGNTLADGSTTVYNSAKGIIMGTQDNIKDVIGDASDLGVSAVKGGVDLAKDTASGAVGLAKDTASGVVGLGKDIVGGTVGLGREIVGGIASLGQGPANLQGPDRTGYYNSYGGANAGGANPNQLLPQNKSSVTDPYSYYGAMPNKGSSNFMPVASDFSKFGR